MFSIQETVQITLFERFKLLTFSPEICIAHKCENGEWKSITYTIEECRKTMSKIWKISDASRKFDPERNFMILGPSTALAGIALENSLEKIRSRNTILLDKDDEKNPFPYSAIVMHPVTANGITGKLMIVDKDYRLQITDEIWRQLEQLFPTVWEFFRSQAPLTVGLNLYIHIYHISTFISFKARVKNKTSKRHKKHSSSYQQGKIIPIKIRNKRMWKIGNKECWNYRHHKKF